MAKRDDTSVWLCSHVDQGIGLDVSIVKDDIEVEHDAQFPEDCSPECPACLAWCAMLYGLRTE